MCEYCKEDLEGKRLASEKSAIEIVVDDEFIYIWCECGRKSVTKINYCPMCGKKLGDS